MKEDNSWKIDKKSKIKYCDKCGEEITDISKAKVYPAGPPYYDEIYICPECAEFSHSDMKGGEAL